MKKAGKWLLLTIAAAIIAWLLTGILDGAFKPLTDDEIIDLMNNAHRQMGNYR